MEETTGSVLEDFVKTSFFIPMYFQIDINPLFMFVVVELNIRI